MNLIVTMKSETAGNFRKDKIAASVWKINTIAKCCEGNAETVRFQLEISVAVF